MSEPAQHSLWDIPTCARCGRVNVDETCGFCGQDYHAPYSDDDTSLAAAQSMGYGKAKTLRHKITEWMLTRGEWGATCDEAEQQLDLSHQTCSARLNELASTKYGHTLHRPGHTRPTRSGRQAKVYVHRAANG